MNPPSWSARIPTSPQSTLSSRVGWLISAPRLAPGEQIRRLVPRARTVFSGFARSSPLTRLFCGWPGMLTLAGGRVLHRPPGRCRIPGRSLSFAVQSSEDRLFLRVARTRTATCVAIVCPDRGRCGVRAAFVQLSFDDSPVGNRYHLAAAPTVGTRQLVFSTRSRNRPIRHPFCPRSLLLPHPRARLTGMYRGGQPLDSLQAGQAMRTSLSLVFGFLFREKKR